MSNTKEKSGYDPKNRIVELKDSSKGKSVSYNVTKLDTGFDSGKITSYEDAVDAYNFQINCSHN